MTTRARDPQPIVTFEWWVAWKEKDAGLVTPLSEDEKALALAVARAHFYVFTGKEELPRSAAIHTYPAIAWGWGLHVVCERRAGRIWA
jgi:hypothetical protein